MDAEPADRRSGEGGDGGEGDEVGRKGSARRSVRRAASEGLSGRPGVVVVSTAVGECGRCSRGRLVSRAVRSKTKASEPAGFEGAAGLPGRGMGTGRPEGAVQGTFATGRSSSAVPSSCGTDDGPGAEEDAEEGWRRLRRKGAGDASRSSGARASANASSKGMPRASACKPPSGMTNASALASASCASRSVSEPEPRASGSNPTASSSLALAKAVPRMSKSPRSAAKGSAPRSLRSAAEGPPSRLPESPAQRSPSRSLRSVSAARASLEALASSLSSSRSAHTANLDAPRPSAFPLASRLGVNALASRSATAFPPPPSSNPSSPLVAWLASPIASSAF